MNITTARQTVFGLFSRSKAAQNVVRLVSATVLAQLMMLVLSPLITRIYSPQQFSMLGLFLSFLSVVIVFSTMTYESAIVSARTNKDADYLLMGASGIALVFSFIASIILGCLIQYRILGYGSLPSYVVWFTGPAVFFLAIVLLSRQWLVRNQRYSLLSKSLLARSCGRCVTQLGVGVVSTGGIGLIAGEVMARIVGAIVCLKYIVPKLKQESLGFSWSELVRTLVAYKRFPLFCMPSRLIDSLAISISAPLIILCYGAEVGGAYVMIVHLLRAPVALIVKNTSDVFHKRLVETLENGTDPILLIHRTLSRLFLVGVLPTLVFVLFADDLTPLVFGSQWTDAGKMATAMAPWILAQFVVGPVSHTMSVYQSYNVKLLYDIVCLLLTLGSIGLSSALGYSALSAVYFLSWSNVAAFILYYFLVRHVALAGLDFDGS